MFKQFFFASLVAFLATVSMSFSSGKTSSQVVNTVESGNALVVTNPSSGTINMNWTFSHSSLSYTVIVELITNRQVVRSLTTSQTSYSTSGLQPGTYRCSVSDGSEIIITELILAG